MEKPHKVKVTETYVFPTKNEAQAFADFKEADALENSELREIKVEITVFTEKQPA